MLYLPQHLDSSILKNVRVFIKRGFCRTFHTGSLIKIRNLSKNRGQYKCKTYALENKLNNMWRQSKEGYHTIDLIPIMPTNRLGTNNYNEMVLKIKVAAD
jgi:hypothetical protein